jgi:hypothetical protein
MEPLHDVQHNSMRPLSFLPSHLSYLVPLDSYGIPRSSQQWVPFTGELNRHNPVWQNLELKENLADHCEAKKKANDYLNGHEALLAEFESLRLASDSKLKLLESEFRVLCEARK